MRSIHGFKHLFKLADENKILCVRRCGSIRKIPAKFVVNWSAAQLKNLIEMNCISEFRKTGMTHEAKLARMTDIADSKDAGETFVSIGKRWKLSSGRVSQIFQKAKRILIRHTSYDINSPLRGK